MHMLSLYEVIHLWCDTIYFAINDINFEVIVYFKLAHRIKHALENMLRMSNFDNVLKFSIKF